MSSKHKHDSAAAIRAAEQQLQHLRLTGKSTEQPPGGKMDAQPATNASVVRCGVRLPKGEWRRLAQLKRQLARQGLRVKKSQLVRAGLFLLVHIERSDLQTAIRDVIAPEAAVPERE